MRLIFVCAMAVTLPTTSDKTASNTNIGCQSPKSGNKVLTSKRNSKAKAAIFGAAAIINVTAVGAP